MSWILSRLWRSIVTEVASKNYPEVRFDTMLVDNTAMQLVKDPGQIQDVILTGKYVRGYPSDDTSMITGSIGMLSLYLSLTKTKFGLYEPSGGSAPDIAGKGIANPIATIPLPLCFSVTAP